MTDRIEYIGKSLIQHGAFNDRIYLMKLHPGDMPGILNDLDDLAGSEGYSRIFVKIPSPEEPGFLSKGYIKEAFIPGFYEGKRDCSFMGKFLSPKRVKENRPERTEDVLEVSMEKREEKPANTNLPNGFSCEEARPGDAEEIAGVYKEVFETYPFPIHDPDYLKETMENNIVYFVVREKGKIAALSSSEMDESSKNVEMTDFATLPDYRGKGTAVFLLDRMEREMKKRGMITSYTIARAESYGMNITFAKRAYKFAGKLLNNTNIAGKFESMNVWYRKL